jgi:uncharacterized protein CbrC (UPF0167 family)
MIAMSEPFFRYHPDPLATGSAVRDRHVCSVCGIERDVRYQGPIYGNQPDSLCLHCIHSGAAARTLGGEPIEVDDGKLMEMFAQFSDAIDVPSQVPPAVVEEIIHRTPGFSGWQQESWLFHCGDGAAFLGPAGYPDLEPHPEALDMLRDDFQRLGWSSENIEPFLRRMSRTGDPTTAYLFRCRHCGTYLASWDNS